MSDNFLDGSVLIYLFDETDPRKRAIDRKHVAEVLAVKNPFKEQ